MFDVSAAAEFLKAVSNNDRFLILTLIMDAEMTVGELAQQMQLSQPALSQHLIILKKQDLVSVRRDGQRSFYQCKSDRVRKILAVLRQYGPR